MAYPDKPGRFNIPGIVIGTVIALLILAAGAYALFLSHGNPASSSRQTAAGAASTVGQTANVPGNSG